MNVHVVALVCVCARVIVCVLANVLGQHRRACPVVTLPVAALVVVLD